MSEPILNFAWCWGTHEHAVGSVPIVHVRVGDMNWPICNRKDEDEDLQPVTGKDPLKERLCPMCRKMLMKYADIGLRSLMTPRDDYKPAPGFLEQMLTLTDEEFRQAFSESRPGAPLAAFHRAIEEKFGLTEQRT